MQINRIRTKDFVEQQQHNIVSITMENPFSNSGRESEKNSATTHKPKKRTHRTDFQCTQKRVAKKTSIHKDFVYRMMILRSAQCLVTGS